MSTSVTPATLLRRRAKALLDPLPAAIAGDAAALHRARIASRRLRELLPVLGPAAKKPRKRVRRLTQLLGHVRELDVAVQLLEEGDAGRIPARLALFEAREHLRRVRDHRRSRMIDRLHKLDLHKLERRLDAAIEAIAAQDPAVMRRKLAARLGNRASRLSRAMSDAGALYVPERLHAVRIAAKKLRYALEIAAEVGVRPAAKLAAAVRRAQVTLGHLQDRTILQRQLHDAVDAVQDPTVGHGLLTLASTLEQECRELHGDFLAMRDAVAAAALAVRQQVVPELARGARGRPLAAAMSGARRPRATISGRLRTHG